MHNSSDYILRVRAGPNIENLSPILVNDEQNPLFIDSQFFTGFLCVRMLNFQGLPPSPDTDPISNPSSSYFIGRNRRYSIMTQGCFKKEYHGDDLVFGIELDSPLRLPSGFQFAIKIAQWLDPALRAELTVEKPWMQSPLVCAMNALSVFEPSDPEINLEIFDDQEYQIQVEDETDKKTDRKPSISDNSSLFHPPKLNQITPLNKQQRQSAKKSDIAGTWSFHSRMIPESTTLLFPPSVDSPQLATYEKRKKYFADQKNREKAVITPGKVYAMDFYDAYFDFNTISFKLPGFSLNALKYFDGQPMRFIAKSRDGQDVFFVIEFALLLRSEMDGIIH